jgi:hypothetical protein
MILQQENSHDGELKISLHIRPGGAQHPSSIVHCHDRNPMASASDGIGIRLHRQPIILVLYRKHIFRLGYIISDVRPEK